MNSLLPEAFTCISQRDALVLPEAVGLTQEMKWVKFSGLCSTVDQTG